MQSDYNPFPSGFSVQFQCLRKSNTLVYTSIHIYIKLERDALEKKWGKCFPFRFFGFSRKKERMWWSLVYGLLLLCFTEFGE